MLTLALSLSLAIARPQALIGWRYSLDATGWTWRGFTPDLQTGVLIRDARTAGQPPRLWVRIESFDGQWKSRERLVAFDCGAGRVSVRQDTVYSGMNLSGEARDEPTSDAWAAPDPLLTPVLKGACGS